MKNTKRFPIISRIAASGNNREHKMFDENGLIHSPLNQTLHLQVHWMGIQIDRMPDTGWTL